MSPRAVFAQAEFFYDGNWSDEIDNYFIEQLVEAAANGQFRVDGDNKVTMEILQWMINEKFNQDFSLEDIDEQVQNLKNRHSVFDWVVHMPSVHYNINTNEIAGEPFVWQHICEMQPLAYAYMEKGEAKWVELNKIFGPQKVFNEFITYDEYGGLLGHGQLNGIPLVDLESPPYDDVRDHSSDDLIFYGKFFHGLPMIDLISGDNSPCAFWRELEVEYAEENLSHELSSPTEVDATITSGGSAGVGADSSTASS